MILGIFGLVFWVVVIYIIVRLASRRSRKAYHWLQRELPVWESEKIITREQGEVILGRYKIKRLVAGKRMDMVKVLTLIGAIFIGVGIIFFVASNWQAIPAHLRTFMLLALTISTLYCGYLFNYEKKGFGNLGKSLLLLAALFWGGTIALIGQIYNIPTSLNWYIMLLWAFPIVPIAIFFENDYVHILASVLFVIWNFLYISSNNIANYYYPAIVGILMLPTAKQLLISRRINIVGLLITSFICCFAKFDWLSLSISTILLSYYLLDKKERVYLYSATLSFIFWSIAYFTVREQIPNPYFILPMGIILYLTYKDKIEENLVLSLVAIMVWLNLMLSSVCLALNYDFDHISFIILQSFLGIVIYGIGIISREQGKAFPAIYKVFGFLVTFFCVYLISFRAMLEVASARINYVYLYGCMFFLAIIALLFLDVAKGSYFKNKSGRWELLALFAAILVNIVVLIRPQMLSLNTILANTVLVIFALTSIFLGVELKKPNVFTMGVIIFVLFIVTRYIDVGWRLKEKSLFFIFGGIIILSLGVFLEKQRRRIIEKMRVG